MNKKLMAVAVAGALAAPGLAMAQAATVSIYGLMDLRLDSTQFSGNTAGNIGSLNKYHLSGGQPNYIGFRGSEDLGSGLSAFFQVETQLFPDARQGTGAQQSTNATLGGRPTFVGLRSTSWGEVSGGYQESLYKDVQKATWSVTPANGQGGIIMGNTNGSGAAPSANCIAQSTSGSNNAALPGATICTDEPTSSVSFNRTVSNSMTYRTPTMGGFRGGVMLTTNELKGSNTTASTGLIAAPNLQGTNNPQLQAYSLTWSGGPFAAAVGYEVHHGFRATNMANPTFSAGTGTLVAAALAKAGNADAKDTGVTIGGQWNYGKGKIGLGWERQKYGQVVADSATDSFTLQAWTVQGTFDLTGSDTIWAGYSKTPGKKDCGGTTLNGTTLLGTTNVGNCGSDTGSKMLSLGVNHSLSKRTTLYAYYSKIDNNANASYNYPSDSRTTNNVGTQNGTAGASAGLAPGVDTTSYNVGLRHTF